MKRPGISPLSLIFCSCLLLVLAACGQRGPLFLPEESATSENAPAEAAAEADTEEKTEVNDDPPSGS
jgi:predicted small lipoprotein YifL